MTNETDELQAKLWKLESVIEMQKYIKECESYSAAGWPPALIKAVHDDYDYALRLKDGSLIYFSRARPMGRNHEWVSLTFCDIHKFENYRWTTSFNHVFNIGGNDRGLEVRVSEIVWVADAPFGS